MKLLIASMELGISLLHQGNPKLILVIVVTIKWSLCLRVVWNSRVNDNMLPSSVLEEVEHCKTILNTVVVDEVFQKLWVCAQYQQRSKEPTIIETKKTLLDITWTIGINLHLGFLIWRYFLRSLPLDNWHILSILWWT